MTYPANEALDVQTTENLVWAPVECSERYDVQVAADPEFQKFITERMGGTVAPLFGKDLDAFLDEMANVFITTAQNLKKNQ